MSRHADRQALAREFGATDIVEERGDEGVAKIKELTGGLGAHSVIEAVGTQESMMQAIRATRPGGHVGYVGVSHDVSLDGLELFFSGVHLHGGPAPVRRFLPELIQLIWDRKIDPGKVFDLTLPLERGRRRLQGDGRTPRHQGAPHRLNRLGMPAHRQGTITGEVVTADWAQEERRQNMSDRQSIRVSEHGQAVAPQTQSMGSDAFDDSTDGTVLYWLGMAGFLINSRGTLVMVDPVLGGFDMPLLIELPARTSDIPRLDAVLVTHADNDHFSIPTCSGLEHSGTAPLPR